MIKSTSLGAWNYPIFLSRRFHRSSYFKFHFISNSDSHGNLSDQLQSQARTIVDMLTWCRAHEDWNLAISREKYLKTDLSVKMPLHWLIMGVRLLEWALDIMTKPIPIITVKSSPTLCFYFLELKWAKILKRGRSAIFRVIKNWSKVRGRSTA